MDINIKLCIKNYKPTDSEADDIVGIILSTVENQFDSMVCDGMLEDYPTIDEIKIS